MKFLASGLFLASVFLYSVPSWAEFYERPFWTEKSSFIEGEDLFVVGIASNAKTVEEGRKQALENGKVELMNFAQVTDVEAKGLVIETQMTFEDPDPNGTVTIYRLLRVSASKLVAIQGRLKEQTRIQEQALDKAQRDLQVAQEAVIRKQQSLEGQNRQVQEKLDTISRLQETLGLKVTRIEQTQREVEALLQQLSAKVKQNDQPHSNASASKDTLAKLVSATGTESLLGKFKETEAKLDAEEAQLRELSKRAKARLAEEDKNARAIERKCKYVEPGMTKEEVAKIMFQPAEEEQFINASYYRYRYMNKKGSTEVITVGFAFNRLVASLNGCPGKTFVR